MKKYISVVAPMYNEGVLVHEYCNKMLEMAKDMDDKYDIELVLVNDGSSDNTYDIMHAEQKEHPDEIAIVCLSRNFGLEGAVNAGLKVAKGDAVIVMDADLQDPPELIPQMLERWENGSDIVVCSRVKRSNDSFFKRAGAGLYYKVLNLLSGKLKLEHSAANFRLLSRKAVEQVMLLPEVNSVFRVVVPYIGMKTSVIGYDRDKRFAGKTKYNFKKMVLYAMDSITGISVEPLRKFIYFFFISLLLSFYSLWMLFFNTGLIRHIYVAIFFMGICFSMMFLALSVIAEYIAQIMIETKGRPSSIIYEHIPSGYERERFQK